MVEKIAVEEGLSPGVARIYSERIEGRSARAPGRREDRALAPSREADPRAHRPVRPHRWAARRGAFHRCARCRRGRRLSPGGLPTRRSSPPSLFAWGALPVPPGTPPRRPSAAGSAPPTPAAEACSSPSTTTASRSSRSTSTSACTTLSVAAHMIYENANPNVMREPSGTLDVTDARYEQLDERRVRVTGSRLPARAVHDQARGRRAGRLPEPGHRRHPGARDPERDRPVGQDPP